MNSSTLQIDDLSNPGRQVHIAWGWHFLMGRRYLHVRIGGEELLLSASDAKTIGNLFLEWSDEIRESNEAADK